jgi:hypothetical protein
MRREILVSIILSTALLAGNQYGQNGTNGTQQHSSENNSSTEMCLDENVTSIADTYPLYTLTQEQEDGLVFMYQEEKVARDVYLTLSDLYSNNTFTNIAKAEQKHMDAVKSLLVKYSLEVPVVSDEIGVFELEALQTAYNDLIAKGEVSETSALEVGRDIELMDIADLEERMVDTTDDIKAVYQKLLDGSYNHLNAFNSALNGDTNSGYQMNNGSSIESKSAQKVTKTVESGWSIISIPVVEEVDITKVLPKEADGALIYTYSNGWNLTELNYNNGVMNQSGSVKVKPFEGFWIHSDREFDISSYLPIEVETGLTPPSI